VTNDQLAKWKAAEAASKRQQHNQRGRRKRGLATVSGVGMVRVPLVPRLCHGRPVRSETHWPRRGGYLPGHGRT
jgi:hypothetical protein